MKELTSYNKNKFKIKEQKQNNLVVRDSTPNFVTVK